MGLSFVKKAKTPTPSDSLSYFLHKVLSTGDSGRGFKRVHASDVTKEDWCPRRHCLMKELGAQENAQEIGTALQMVFDQGNLLAKHVLNVMAQSGILLGDWECIHCGAMHRFRKKPGTCSKCSRSWFRYEEVRITSNQSGISCGIDAFVSLPSEVTYRIVEIKTMDKEMFKSLKMPLAEHRLRTSLYLQSFLDSDHPAQGMVNTDEGLILYISKGGFGEKRAHPKEWGFKDTSWTPFKEFKIERDQKIHGDYEALAKPVKARQEGGALPCGICPSAYADRAQSCEVVGPCFSGAYK